MASFLKNKKALTASFIVGMMITLIAFVLISGTLMRFIATNDDIQMEVLCQESIALRAQTAIYSNGKFLDSEIKVVPPLCATIDKKIKGDREKIKKEVADSMARCWWMFGEGRYEEILDSFDVSTAVLGLEDTENQCFNCYTLLLDVDEIEGGPIPGSEIQDYLVNTKYSKFGVSYLDYIQSHGGPGNVMLTVPFIEAKNAYAISMMPKNKEIPDSTFWKGVGAVAVGAVIVVGVVVGAVCVIGSGGTCAAVLSAGAAVAGQGAALSGGVAATTAVGALGATGTVALGGAGAYSAYAGYNNIMASFYSERDVSSIYLGFLDVAQEMCPEKDLKGE